MQDIAREAGYTAASLYTYFKSKQEIVDAMVTLANRRIHPCLRRTHPVRPLVPPTLRVGAATSTRARRETAQHLRGLLRATTPTRACALRDETGRAFHDNFERRIERLAAWLKANASADDIGGHAPDLLARTLFGMAFGLLHRWGAEDKHEPFVKYAPIITELFFHGISGKTKPGARKK